MQLIFSDSELKLLDDYKKLGHSGEVWLNEILWERLVLKGGNICRFCIHNKNGGRCSINKSCAGRSMWEWNGEVEGEL